MLKSEEALLKELNIENYTFKIKNLTIIPNNSTIKQLANIFGKFHDTTLTTPSDGIILY